LSYIREVELGGVRALHGVVRLGPGLNIVLGPNNSGKTTLLEAITISLLVNTADVKENLAKLMILEAARGSLPHALDSIVPTGGVSSAKPCTRLASGAELCAEISKEERVESMGVQLSSVVHINIISEKCRLTIALGKGFTRLSAEGPSCFRGGMMFNIVPSGIMPYNSFDAMLGKIKRTNPELLQDLGVEIAGRKYTLDLGVDSWNEAVALIHEEGVHHPIMFYSVGRGLQRVFQIMAMSKISDIVMIDEIESAMHPALLKQLVRFISSEVRNGRRQIILTSQSSEAVAMLVSALLDPSGITGDINSLRNMVDRICNVDKEILDLLNLIVLRRSGEDPSRVSAALFSGCNAVWEITSSGDPRLSYQILR